MINLLMTPKGRLRAESDFQSPKQVVSYCLALSKFMITQLPLYDKNFLASDVHSYSFLFPICYETEIVISIYMEALRVNIVIYWSELSIPCSRETLGLPLHIVSFLFPIPTIFIWNILDYSEVLPSQKTVSWVWWSRDVFVLVNSILKCQAQCFRCSCLLWQLVTRSDSCGVIVIIIQIINDGRYIIVLYVNIHSLPQSNFYFFMKISWW